MGELEANLPPRLFWRAGRAPACLWAAGILFLVLVSVGNLPHLASDMSDAYGDKPLHCAFYILVSLLIYSAIAWRPGLMTVSIVSALALLDESIQSLFPYRSTDLLDLLIDIASSIATVTLLHIGLILLGKSTEAGP